MPRWGDLRSHTNGGANRMLDRPLSPKVSSHNTPATPTNPQRDRMGSSSTRDTQPEPSRRWAPIERNALIRVPCRGERAPQLVQVARPAIRPLPEVPNPDSQEFPRSRRRWIDRPTPEAKTQSSRMRSPCHLSAACKRAQDLGTPKRLRQKRTQGAAATSIGRSTRPKAGDARAE